MHAVDHLVGKHVVVAIKEDLHAVPDHQLVEAFLFADPCRQTAAAAVGGVDVIAALAPNGMVNQDDPHRLIGRSKGAL